MLVAAGQVFGSASMYSPQGGLKVKEDITGANCQRTNPMPQLLRVAGLKTAQLPAATASADELRPFVTALLGEAVPFIDTAAPRAADFPDPEDPPKRNLVWWDRGSKAQEGSDAMVEVSQRRVVPTTPTTGPGAEISNGGGSEEEGNGKEKGKGKEKREGETWVCRRSVHADRAEPGSASWAEFASCIRDRHAETEDAFTPDVLGHHVAVTWDALDRLGDDGHEPIEAGGLHWGRIGLRIVEMKHKVPPPLRPRVFPVLQLIASAVLGGDKEMADPHSRQPQDEFVIVSVTVPDLAEGAMRHAADLCAETEQKKGVVIGAYASVERVRRLPSGEIEWLMATVSDAKGVLPSWVQAKAIPGQVVKDVGLFLRWIASQRDKIDYDVESVHFDCKS